MPTLSPESPTPAPREFYTVQELAEMLRLHEMTIYRMAKRGQLPHYCIGRAMRFGAHDIEAFLEGAKHGAIPSEESEADQLPLSAPMAS